MFRSICLALLVVLTLGYTLSHAQENQNPAVFYICLLILTCSLTGIIYQIISELKPTNKPTKIKLNQLKKSDHEFL